MGSVGGGSRSWGSPWQGCLQLGVGTGGGGGVPWAVLESPGRWDMGCQCSWAGWVGPALCGGVWLWGRINTPGSAVGFCSSLPWAHRVKARQGCKGGQVLGWAVRTSPRRANAHKPFPGAGSWGGWGSEGFFFPGGKWTVLVGTRCAPLQLLSLLSLPSLSDFVPIDLEEWWAQQFLAKIENCS